ncbi:hypothetical protein KSE_18310 [Kitasatospora setae KM-6054]|uniref:Uncharacterized protein n=1 Tax=Kitasatospora setae (strain ATCC 33774 / DSM 43861 / JCM 3304 / KCC A-0304 / NBRC 14216 / KM-6054) TaxID=452652 RepID=E4N8X5_KITSK|nr:hypothetical protein KSE_18310 [Kitasatospora setae KM-6054]
MSGEGVRPRGLALGSPGRGEAVPLCGRPGCRFVRRRRADRSADRYCSAPCRQWVRAVERLEARPVGTERSAQADRLVSALVALDARTRPADRLSRAAMSAVLPPA